ncbi:hypothetical protein [Rhizobium rhizogenes]|uniref:Terminase large subunit n=1 Tax=Rhizobium rhizogenes NBRC 13257 TaxID=1220581 RepID=A0AA87QBP7_RHIRH|nr:hypothetical protein [Rhizobium rhizogenes]GAJ96185.1 hypothetical protein RRH01S_18_00280 [Rhizobium rhizogenes NBRC 13257]
MKVRVSLREALRDDNLLGQAIAGESWSIWRALLMAAMGETLTPEEREMFSLVTGRSQEPQQRVEEFWTVAGRRSGKTRAAAVLGAYLATCIDWTDCLSPGERAVLPVLAANTYQASRAFMHLVGILQHSPDLSALLEGEPTADAIRLSTRVDINIVPANFKTIRSITAIAIICDEIAFWSIEGSKNPDKEILTAARPALATTEGPLVCISSPYARRGELWTNYRKDFKPDGDPLILIANAESKVLNSTLPQRVIDRAYERDPSAASAEYGGKFRTDVETLLSREVVEAAVDVGVVERAREPGIRYYGFVDPSGGSSDSMTLGIAHKEGNRAVLDVLRERKPPYSPEAVTKDFCELLKSYGILSLTGDNFGGEWCKEPFSRHGVTYERSTAPKSELYAAMVPAINSGRVGLLDNERATNQLVELERRSGSSGRDIIDHPPGAAFHDDVANAVAGAVFQVLGKRAPLAISEAALTASRQPTGRTFNHPRLSSGGHR